MDIYTAFAVCCMDWDWTDESCEGFDVHDEEDGFHTDDFVIGTFSSMEKLREAVAEFLPKYEVGKEEMLDVWGNCDPIVLVTAWKTTLDDPTPGTFVEEIRTREQLQTYPYK